MQRELMPYAEAFWSRAGVRPGLDGDTVAIINLSAHLKDGDSWDNHNITHYLSIDGPIIDLVCSCGKNMGVTYSALQQSGMRPMKLMKTLLDLNIPEKQREPQPEVKIVVDTIELDLNGKLTPEAAAVYAKQNPNGDIKLFRFFSKKIRLGDGGEVRPEYTAKMANVLNNLTVAKMIDGVRGPVVCFEQPSTKVDLVNTLNRTPTLVIRWGVIILWVQSNYDVGLLNQVLGNEAFVEPGTIGNENWINL